MHHTYKTQMTCSRQIDFDLDGNVVHNIKFEGGCNGNLKAIGKILEGWTVEQIEERVKGNTCGPRPTSCADQLARALRIALDEEQGK